MPIGSKKMEKEENNLEAAPESMPSAHGCGGRDCCRGQEFGKKILMTLFGVLLVYLTFYIGTLMRNDIKRFYYIGQADSVERTVTIAGTAKVNAKNDIAVTTIGFSNVDAQVAKAQTDNKKVMDQVLAELKSLGIEEKDLQSNYMINPEYDYTQKGSEFKGYRVTNNVTVKIRDLSKINDVLNLPGKYGANQVGGLSFTIDDTENLKNQAREKALVDAKSKAAQLAMRLGVRLGEVVSYSDYENQQPMPIYNYAQKAMGIGGAADAGPAEVASGSQDIAMNVSITYKIYPGAW